MKIKINVCVFTINKSTILDFKTANKNRFSTYLKVTQKRNIKPRILTIYTERRKSGFSTNYIFYFLFGLTKPFSDSTIGSD